MDDEHEEPCHIHQWLMAEENLPEYRDIAHEWDGPGWENGGGTPRVLEEHGAAQKAGDAHRKDVEHCTANDLIDAAMYRQDGMHCGHDTPYQDCHRQAYPGIGRIERNDKAETGCSEHHAFNADVDHATALTEQTCQGTQGNRRRQTQALGQQAQHLKALSHTGPDEDAAHESDDIEAKAHGMEARRWSGNYAPYAGDEGHPAARQQGVPGGKLHHSHGPKTQDGQDVRRYRVSPPPESHTAEEIEQAESLVVTLHEVLPTPHQRAGVAECVQDGLRPGP